MTAYGLSIHLHYIACFEIQQDSPLFYPRKRVLSTFACYKTSQHASLSILPHLFLLYVCPKLNILSFNTHTHTPRHKPSSSSRKHKKIIIHIPRNPQAFIHIKSLERSNRHTPPHTFIHIPHRHFQRIIIQILI